jgi:hypothetical protein
MGLGCRKMGSRWLCQLHTLTDQFPPLNLNANLATNRTTSNGRSRKRAMKSRDVHGLSGALLAKGVEEGLEEGGGSL